MLHILQITKWFAIYQLEVDKSFGHCNFSTTLTLWITWTAWFVLPWISKRTFLACSSGCTHLYDIMLLSLGQQDIAGFLPFLPSLNSSQFFTLPLSSSATSPTCLQSRDLICSPLILVKNHNFLLLTANLACSHSDIGLPNILQTPQDERERWQRQGILRTLFHSCSMKRVDF